ncbi:MAG TPA: RNA polymerase subunit sigma-70, partial [Parvularcula sp.]|nr:RNA polymerase subunit sigma-70 [Parvularcula sp.]
MASLLRPYFFGQLRSRQADVEDLVQEKLIAVRTRRSTVERSGPQSASTHAVAMHKRIDDLRWRKAAGAPVDQA